jgi:hypothetical protein
MSLGRPGGCEVIGVKRLFFGDRRDALRRAAATLAIVAWSVSGCAQQRAPRLSEAATVVQRYCQMDADGLGLKSNTAEPMWALVAGHVELDEGAIVISGFRIVKEESRGNDARVHVAYDVVADWPPWGAVRVAARTDTRIYDVLKTSAGWRIRGPQVLWDGYVSPSPLMRHLQDVIAANGDPTDPNLAELRAMTDRYRRSLVLLKQLSERQAKNAKR